MDLREEETPEKEKKKGFSGNLTREEIKEASLKINETLVELKELLKVADYLGAEGENPKGKETIKYAVEASKEGRYWDSLVALQEGKDFLKEVLDEKIENEVMDLSLSVDMMRDESKASKVNRLITKIEKAKEEEEYERVPELVFKAWENIKK